MNRYFPLEGLVYWEYRVLIEDRWRVIDLFKPLLPQLKGMRAYRLISNGEIIKQSDIREPA